VCVCVHSILMSVLSNHFSLTCCFIQMMNYFIYICMCVCVFKMEKIIKTIINFIMHVIIDVTCDL